MFPSLSPPSTSLLSLPLIPCPSSKGSEERSNHTEEVVITCTRVYYIHAAGQWKNKPCLLYMQLAGGRLIMMVKTCV